MRQIVPEQRTGPQAVRGATASEPKVRITGLTKTFTIGGKEVTALQDVSLDIAAGEFVVVIGPSGCGKTTMLRIVDGLDEQSHGHIVCRHDDPAKPLSSMIFQEHAIFPWMSVERNIGYGLRAHGQPKQEIAATVDRLVRQMGLTEYRHAFPHQLSGGMKQRVSIARAFANDPEILCMDEPFAALDEQNKAILLEELMRIWSESRKTALFITHSLDEALVLSDRIVAMTARPGRIAAVFDNPFPRPRKTYELRRDPRYGELSTEIWNVLRTEVLKSRGELPS